MESEGPRASSNPKATLVSLMGKKGKLQEDLRNIEKQIYDLETSYLQDSSHYVNILKGFEGFRSSSKNTSFKKSRKFQPEERLFSLSSVSSPVVEENGLGRDDIGQLRPKAGGQPANGQGKPKRGRMAPKDGKRTKNSSEQDQGGKDEPDLSSR